MSFASATPAQRQEVRDEAVKTSFAVQPFTQNAYAPTAAEDTVIGTQLSAMAAALSAVGVTGLLPTQAVVANGGTVNVENSAGALDSPATAVVAGGVLTGVNLAATKTIVTNADAVTMQNSAGTAIAGTHSATVAAGVLSNVKLAATVAPVINGVKINATSVTGTGNFATITVTAGVITAIVLSAS